MKKLADARRPAIPFIILALGVPIAAHMAVQPARDPFSPMADFDARVMTKGIMLEARERTKRSRREITALANAPLARGQADRVLQAIERYAVEAGIADQTGSARWANSVRQAWNLAGSTAGRSADTPRPYRDLAQASRTATWAGLRQSVMCGNAPRCLTDALEQRQAMQTLESELSNIVTGGDAGRVAHVARAYGHEFLLRPLPMAGQGIPRP